MMPTLSLLWNGMTRRGIFLILLLLIGAPLFSEPVLQIAVPRTAKPKSIITLIYTLENDTPQTLEFQPSLHIPESWKVVSKIEQISVPPETTIKGWISLSIPLTALGGIEHPITLKLEPLASEYSPLSTSTSLIIEKKEAFHVSILPHSNVLWAGEKQEVNLFIRNEGNTETEIQLDVRAIHPWEIHFPKKTPPLKPGQTLSLPIAITGPKYLQGGQENFFTCSLSTPIQEKKIHFRLLTLPEASSISSRFYPIEHSIQTKLLDIGEGGVPKTQLYPTAFGQTGEHASFFFEGTGTFFGKDEQGLAFREEHFTLEFLNPEHSKVTLGETRRKLTYLTDELQGNAVDLYGESSQFRGVAFYSWDPTTIDTTRQEQPWGGSVYKRLGATSETGIHYVDYQLKSTSEESIDDDQVLSLTAYHEGDCYHFDAEVAQGFTRSFDWSDNSLGMEFKASFTPENWLALAEYRHIDQSFPGNLSNQKGYRLLTSHALIPSFSIWGEFLHQRTNPEDDLETLTQTRHRITLGGNFNKAGYLPTLNFSAEREGQTFQNDPEKTFSRIYRARLNASQTFFGYNFNLRSLWEQEKDHFFDQKLTDYNHQFFINKRFEKFSTLLRGNWQRIEELERLSKSQVYEGSGIYDTDNWGSYFALLGIEWQKSPRFSSDRSYRWEAGILFEKVKERFELRYREKQITTWGDQKEEVESRRVLAKYTHFFSRKHYLELFYEYENERSSSHDHRLSLLYLYTFHTPGPFPRANQAVTGRLFLEEGNLPLEKLKVTVGGYSTYTDRKGAFEISELPPGTYPVELDTTYLASGLQKSQKAPSQITIEKGKTSHLEIPVVASGKICGKIELSSDETPPRGGFHLLLYSGSNLVREGYVSPSGTFCLNNLEPGNYVLKLDTSQLSSNTLVSPEEGISFSLQGKETLENLNFHLEKKERKIKIKKF